VNKNEQGDIMDFEYIQVLTTVESYEDAEKIAQALLNKRLAACIQIIGPITSLYWWEEKIEKATEYLLLIKTKKNLYKKLEKAIIEVHHYKVPEIIANPVTGGNPEYLKWLDQEVSMP